MRPGDYCAFTDAQGSPASGVAWERGPLVRGGWVDPWWLWLPSDGCFVLAATSRRDGERREAFRLAPGQVLQFDPLHGWRVGAAEPIIGVAP